MMVILDNFMSHFLICFKHILRLNAGPFPFPSSPTPVIFEITFSISSRHMNHIWSNGNLAWIKIWLYVEKEIWIAIVSQGFKIMEAMGSPLSHQQLLTSIPSSLPTSSNGFFIEIHENIIKVDFFIEDDIWALEHHDVCTYKFSSWRWLWRFLVKFCDSTQDLFKHTKHFSTWINRYVHPGVS